MAIATPTINAKGRNGEVGKPRLKRSMGLWMATALVIGNMVGSGIFTLPGVLAGEAGPASILSLVFTGLGAMLLALVFANLGRAYPRTGGPYHFARRAFGDFAGFQTAWACELRRLRFAAGSIGPKVEAACRFVEHTGHEAAIGALNELDAVARGEAGTRITSAARLAPFHGVPARSCTTVAATRHS